MIPVALGKAKIVCKFGLSESSGVKRKTGVLSKDIKIILLHYLLIFFNCQNSYMHS